MPFSWCEGLKDGVSRRADSCPTLMLWMVMRSSKLCGGSCMASR